LRRRVQRGKFALPIRPRHVHLLCLSKGKWFRRRPVARSLPSNDEFDFRPFWKRPDGTTLEPVNTRKETVMALDLTGLHHLTAVTANARENLRFYTRVLGLRLVKRTVNQDDTSAYHLFYGDGRAS